MKKALYIIISLVFVLILGFQVKASYPVGSLLKSSNNDAVYYIGEDNKKYVFPDGQTYFTWYENFDDIVTVSIQTLDEYADGGAMPYRAGTKLITHQNTVKIYAVEPNGIIRWLPTATIAQNLYGSNWHLKVRDVIPGFFSTSYTLGSELSDTLPDGTIIKQKNTNNYFYISNGQRSSFADYQDYRSEDIIELDDLSNYPGEDGDEIIIDDTEQGDDTDDDESNSVVDNDQDNDGYDSTSSGGTDCNDSNSSINPSATDICGDGIDQDCSGADLSCSAPGNVSCGDSYIDITEYCDDGNTSNGDGCSASCEIESYYSCQGQPSSCTYLGSTYGWYNDFSLNHFGAEFDDLIYEKQGSSLTLVGLGDWTYASENSASIAFETNLPARSYIEYGSTTSYGSRTYPEERFFFNHLHYLTGLNPSTTYHYRIISKDERGNTITGSDRTIATRTFANKIEITGDGPHILDQDNTVYILKEDISSDTRGFTIDGAGITLDLNGYTLTYDQGTPLVIGEWDDYFYSNWDSTAGVYATMYRGTDDYLIVNGHIVQGANKGNGSVHGIGFNPLLINDGSFEVAGLDIEYTGDDVNGINAQTTGLIHHNIINDADGTVITNRHQGIKSIVGTGDLTVHHNLVKRTHHQGIQQLGLQVYDNEIYLDSFATNSFAIFPVAGASITNNKIFGTGSMPIGIGWGTNLNISDNLIYFHGLEIAGRSDEYGTGYSIWGIRLTQYDSESNLYQNNSYDNNYVIINGETGARNLMAVAFSSDLYVENMEFTNNTFKVMSLDNSMPSESNFGGFACIVSHGVQSRAAQHKPVLYQDNLCISNVGFVQFASNYASGSNTHLVNNTFRKIGSHPKFDAIQIGYWIVNSYNHRLIDTNLEGGASLDDYYFLSNDTAAELGFSVGHSMYIQAKDDSGNILSNQIISIYDNYGLDTSYTTNSQGIAKIELLEYSVTKPVGTSVNSKNMRSGHQASISGYNNVDLPLNITDNQSSPLVLNFSN